jgi:hypothetical protein
MAGNLNERLKTQGSTYSAGNGEKPKAPLQRDWFSGKINDTFLSGTYKNTLSVMGKLIAFGRIK